MSKKQLISFASHLGIVHNSVFDNEALLTEIDALFKKLTVAQLGLLGSTLSIAKGAIHESYRNDKPVFVTKPDDELKRFLSDKKHYHSYYDAMLIQKPKGREICSVMAVSTRDPVIQMNIQNGLLGFKNSNVDLSLYEVPEKAVDFAKSIDQPMEFNPKDHIEWVGRAIEYGNTSMEVVDQLALKTPTGKSQYNILKNLSQGMLIQDESAGTGQIPRKTTSFASSFASTSNTITYSYANAGKSPMSKNLPGVPDLVKFVVDPWNIGVGNAIQADIIKTLGLQTELSDSAYNGLFETYLRDESVRRCIFNPSWISKDLKDAGTNKDRKDEVTNKYRVLLTSKLIYLGYGDHKWVLERYDQNTAFPPVKSLFSLINYMEIIARLYSLYGLSNYLAYFIKNPVRISFSDFLDKLRNNCPFIRGEKKGTVTAVGAYLLGALEIWTGSFKTTMVCSDYLGLKSKYLPKNGSIDISLSDFAIDDDQNVNADDDSFDLDGYGERRDYSQKEKFDGKVSDITNLEVKTQFTEKEKVLQTFIEGLNSGVTYDEGWVSVREALMDKGELDDYSATKLLDYMAFKFARSSRDSVVNMIGSGLSMTEWQALNLVGNDFSPIDSEEANMMLKRNDWLLKLTGCKEVGKIILTGGLLDSVISVENRDKALEIPDNDWPVFVNEIMDDVFDF